MIRYADYVVEQFMTMLESSDNDSFRTLNETMDPLYLEFLIIPHFNDTSGLLADESNVNSALRFLKANGETDRYEELKQFISLFKELMQQCMYLFKEVAGINEAINRKSNEPMILDAKLDFTCWESVDYRMQALLTMYKSIAYDFSNRYVEILPVNLRRFKLSIYTADIRILVNDPAGKNFRDFGRTIDHLNIDIISRNHRIFHFGHCEFIPDAAADTYSSLSSTEFDEAEVKFSIMYKTFVESAKFRSIFGDYKIESTAKNVPVNDRSYSTNQADLATRKSAIERLGKRIDFISNISESYQKFEDQFARSDKRDLINTFLTSAGVLNRQTRLRNVFEDDFEFFTQIENNSITTLAQSLGTGTRNAFDNVFGG